MDKGYIPRRYKSARLEDHGEALQRLLRGVLEGLDNGTGVVVEGQNGVGKTHIVCAAANQALAENRIRRPAVYLQAGSLLHLSRLQDEFREQSWMDTFCNCELLIIDDMGKEPRASDAQVEQSLITIGHILRVRVQDMRPTYITTNLAREDFGKTYGRSIADLMNEVAGEWIEYDRDSRRSGDNT